MFIYSNLTVHSIEGVYTGDGAIFNLNERCKIQNYIILEKRDIQPSGNRTTYPPGNRTRYPLGIRPLILWEISSGNREFGR